MQPLAFCDTETTGFYVDAGHEAWEVAVIVRRDGGTVEKSWQLPVDVSKADPQSLAMNGWYRRSTQHKHPSSVTQFIDVDDDGTGSERRAGLISHRLFAAEFMELVHGCSLIGAVPSFDERFVTKALRKGNGVHCWHYQPIDVETLAVGWILGMSEATATLSAAAGEGTTSGERELAEVAELLRMPPWDSETISNVIGVNPDLFERHSALGDCRWAEAIWDLIMTPPAQQLASSVTHVESRQIIGE